MAYSISIATTILEKWSFHIKTYRFNIVTV